MEGAINMKTSLNRLNYYGFCRNRDNFFLEITRRSPFFSLKVLNFGGRKGEGTLYTITFTFFLLPLMKIEYN